MVYPISRIHLAHVLTPYYRELEVKGMAERIIEMRHVLYEQLTNKLKTPGDWSHIKSQIGMFRYAPLPQFFMW